ncbi:TRAP transporter small permease [Martelella sp. AMO21009]
MTAGQASRGRLADRVLARIEALFLSLSVIAMIVITGIICYGIFARSLHLPGLPDDVLIVRQLMVATIAAALGHATATRGHIAVDLLYQHLPAPLRKGCNLLALAVGLVAFGPLCAFAFSTFREALSNGDYMYGKLKLPEWPAEFAFFLGLFAMNLRLLLLLIGDLLRSGPYDAPPGGAE